VPSADEVLTFREAPPPPGTSPLVPGEEPDTSGIVLVEHDPTWADTYAELAGRVRQALGLRVLALHHIGSTAVPGLAAKPIIDMALVVADPDDEDAYVPPLATAGFRLRIREPWWYRHRMLRSDSPQVNLHVYGPESPEPLRNQVFRDWLRQDAGDRARYAAAKAEAGLAANARGESVMEYNARKQLVIREIYARAFAAAGFAPGS
jgi:GrpB-like predicted nucleotidyltransferase (UPF0157 family)